MPIKDGAVYDVYIGLLRRTPASSAEWEEARACANESELSHIIRGRAEFREAQLAHRQDASPFQRPLIINCEQDGDRRSHVRAQFSDDVGHAPEFVKAIDARLPTFTAEYAGCFDERLPIKGTAGCFLSHRKCWQHIVDRNLAAAFICEDDVVFDWTSRTIKLLDLADFHFDLVFCNARALDYRKLTGLPESEFFVPVGEVYRRCREQLGVRFDEQCHGGMLHPVGGDGYILTQSGARLLLLHDAKKAVNFHVDFYLWFRCLASIDMFSGDNVGFVRLLMKYHGINLPRLRGYVAPYPVVRNDNRLRSVREPG